MSCYLRDGHCEVDGVEEISIQRPSCLLHVFEGHLIVVLILFLREEVNAVQFLGNDYPHRTKDVLRIVMKEDREYISI